MKEMKGDGGKTHLLDESKCFSQRIARTELKVFVPVVWLGPRPITVPIVVGIKVVVR
jgi:hypothetical protein